MDRIKDEKERRIIEEQAARIRLFTDLTQAGSWVINFAPDGSLSSVQWGDGFRRLMGYSDRNDFPNEIESFLRGIYPEDRDTFIGAMLAGVLMNTSHAQQARISAFTGRTVQSGGSAAAAY